MPKSIVGVVGIVLIVVGAIALIWGGITYTTRERVVDVGPLEVEAEEQKTIPMPPVLGGLALVSGVLLLAASRKR